MRNPLTILVDMDDTIENFLAVWVQHINQKFGTQVSYEDIKEWDMTKSFPTLTLEQIFSPLNSVHFWDRVEPLTGAVEYLKKLMDDGHHIYIVTSSHYNTLVAKFDRMLFKHFPFLTFKNIIVTHNKQIIQGDILIDDAPHNLEGGNYRGVLMTAPHNINYDAESHGFKRVHNWEEIYNFINTIE